MPQPPERRKILVMRYRFIGDTLLTVPFLRNLRRAYPGAQIDMLVAPGSGEVLRDCPYIDRLIEFDTTRKHRYENQKQPRKRFWTYIGLLRRENYDTAFVLKRSFSSGALAFLAGIPERIGFDTEGRGWLLTQGVPYPQDRHEVDCFLDVLEAADLPVVDRHLESWWSPAEEDRASERLGEPGQHVAVHLTSSNPAKQWDETQALSFLKWLLARPGVTVHHLGAASDAELYEKLKAQLPGELQKRVRLHCGELSLLESMALLKRMRLVVGVDSGTLHMAAAVGTPVVALFGPMDDRKWAPPGAEVLFQSLPCRPCNLKIPCPVEYECMRTLESEQVQKACRIHLNC